LASVWNLFDSTYNCVTRKEEFVEETLNYELLIKIFWVPWGVIWIIHSLFLWIWFIKDYDIVKRDVFFFLILPDG